MKNITLIIFCTILGYGIHAQTTAPTSDDQGQKNNFLSVFGGMSMPSGNWSKTAYNIDENGKWLADDKANTSAGFTGNGAVFGIEGAYFFSKYFGIGGMASHTTFKFKGLDTLSGGYQASFDVDQVTTSISGGTKLWTFMPGIYLKYPFGNKFSVTGKFLAGFTSVTTPSISVDVMDGGIDDGTFVQQSATANSFGYMAGIGFAYNIMPCMAVHLNADYFSCKPDLMIANTNRANNAGRLLSEYNQQLTTMNLSLGVSYLFGNNK